MFDKSRQSCYLLAVDTVYATACWLLQCPPHRRHRFLATVRALSHTQATFTLDECCPANFRCTMYRVGRKNRPLYYSV